MLVASDEYRERITQTQAALFRASLTLADGSTIQLAGDDVDLGSPTFSDAVSSSGSFDVGAAIISQLTLTLNNRDMRFDSVEFGGAVITPQIGVQLSGGTTEWLRKGVYYVERPESKGSTIRLTCYDSLKRLERLYYASGKTYPAMLSTIAREACSACGVTLATETFPHSDYLVWLRPDDANLTCLEVVSYVAQLACCFVDADQLGRVRIRWYDDTAFGDEDGADGGTFSTSTAPYSDGDALFGGYFMYGGDEAFGGSFAGTARVDVSAIRDYTVNTEDKEITGVYVTSESRSTMEGDEFLHGEDGYIVRIEGNPLVEPGMARGVAYMVGSRLVGMRFRPLEVRQIGDPTIEAGDAVQVSDRLGRVYRAYATQVDYSMSGTTRIACGARSESKLVTRPRRTEAQKRIETVEEEVDTIPEIVTPIVERTIPDVLPGALEDPTVQQEIIDIVTPSIPTVPVIHGLDGNDYIPYVDENGDFGAQVIPSAIEVTTLPTKTSYRYGEQMDFSGIVVTAYDGNGNDLGSVPFEELSFDPTTAPVGRSFLARADSILDNACIVSENNGTRTPMYKTNDGSCAGIISTDFHGDTWGGNWIGVALLSTSADAARVSSYQAMLSTVTVDGVTLYVGSASTNQQWGGGTTFTNPHGLPVVNTRLCSANANFSESEVRNLMNLLQFAPLLEGGLVTVIWPRTGDGSVLTTTFPVNVDTGGWTNSGNLVDSVIDAVQEQIDAHS